MRIRAIFTDLDGTLLEPDGSIRAEALEALHELVANGVAVYLVTSKTAAELVELLARLRLETPAGFENGAGVVFADGSVLLGPEAVPVDEVRALAVSLRAETGAPLRTLDELDDEELMAVTGLPISALPGVRDRRATMPLRVPSRWDRRLRRSLPVEPRMRLVRGDRFLHLQGDHDKTTVMNLLLARLPERDGAVVSLGDSPNDLELLAAADVAVIVPSDTGPHPELVRRLPGARVAPGRHGRGWAMAVRQMIERTPTWT